MLAAAAIDEPDILGRLLLTGVEDARRFGRVSIRGGLVTEFQEKSAAPGRALINAGVAVLRREVLPMLGASLENETFPALAQSGQLCATIGQGAFIDIGVPDQLAFARATLPARLHRRALFLDRDGVINKDHGYVGSQDRFDFTPGALTTIRRAGEAGWHVFVVTNQSGIARGLYSEAEFNALHAWLLDQALMAGGTIDDMRYCPFHPDAPLPAYRQAHPWRKPAPGMLLDLIRTWQLDPARCLMIGDSRTDMEAAAAAAVPGLQFLGGDLADFTAGLFE